MKIAAVSIVLLTVLSILSACSTAYRLESGSYVLSIKQATTSGDMPKAVSIQVHGQTIKIQNPDHDLVFTGQVEGNTFQAVGKNDTQTIEFQGNLVGDNRVAGKVIQKSAATVTREADFTIKKAEQKK